MTEIECDRIIVDLVWVYSCTVCANLKFKRMVKDNSLRGMRVGRVFKCDICDGMKKHNPVANVMKYEETPNHIQAAIIAQKLIL